MGGYRCGSCNVPVYEVMGEILSIIWNDIFGITVPVLNITFKQFVIGMFVVFFLISILRRKVRGGED